MSKAQRIAKLKEVIRNLIVTYSLITESSTTASAGAANASGTGIYYDTPMAFSGKSKKSKKKKTKTKKKKLKITDPVPITTVKSESKKKECPPGKVLNEKTNRCINIIDPKTKKKRVMNLGFRLRGVSELQTVSGTL